MAEEGADIIDVGGESTRPGSDPISPEEEMDRVMPVLEVLVRETSVPLSIDTYKSQVAEEALKLGVAIVNDISGLRFDPRMAEVAAQYSAAVVIMHIKGTPKNMQQNPHYDDLMGEILQYLDAGIRKAQEVGIPRNKLVVDPGIGFGKRLRDNYVILRRLRELRVLGVPVLIGPSRKSFIGKVLNLPPQERLEGTAAAVTVGILNGADIVRVHDVKAMSRVVKIADCLAAKIEPSE